MPPLDDRQNVPDAASVLHLAAPARHGGLERVILELATAQVHQGRSVAVALVLEPGDEVDHPLVDALGARSIPLELVVLPARRYFAERKAVVGLLERLSPSVLHTHGYRADVVDADVARARGVASVTTAHGFAATGRRGAFYERLQTFVARWSDAIVAVSEPIAHRFVSAGVPPTRVHLVPNAIGTVSTMERATARSMLGLPPDRFVVGWVGRLSQEKGPDLFVRAMADVSSDTIGVMIGDGPERQHVGALISELGLEDRIRLAGAVPEASTHFSALDVFALTSRTEGTPMTLLEAMAAGVPIVATGVGGVPAVLEDDAGIVVPLRSLEAIAAAFETLRRNPERARALARTAGRRVRDRYGVEPWVRAYDAVYAAATKRRHTS